ncbi:unnamed protein product [Mesocestoides corti]|uniref:Mitofilin n=1 Tax=Mesocestoides corti TaxID=53468 RepID=A0A0R3U2W1_MESCO|nr:unnamed protein product [Mesocestoides corti]
MGVVGGAVLVVYLSPTVREYAIEAAPHLKPYIQQVDDFVAKYKQKMSSIELPKMPTLPSFSSSDHKSSLEAFSTGVNISPSFPSASDVSRQVAAIPEHLQDVQVDIKTAIRNSKKAAQEALDDIHRLQVVIESCISDYQNPSRKLGFANLDGDKLEAAQRKAKESHQVAQYGYSLCSHTAYLCSEKGGPSVSCRERKLHLADQVSGSQLRRYLPQHLSQLRSALDSAKSSVSEQNQDLIKAAIASYGDLAYDLSSAVTEASSTNSAHEFLHKLSEGVVRSGDLSTAIGNGRPLLVTTFYPSGIYGAKTFAQVEGHLLQTAFGI